MPIDYDMIEENDAFSAASLNSRFGALVTGINDLPEYAVEDRGIGPAHTPSLVIDITPDPGLTRRFNVSPPYTASPPTYNGTGAWGNNDADWAVVSDGSGGTTVNSGDLVITFDEITLGMAEANKIGAMRVNVNLGLTLPANSGVVVFCLQYLDGGGTWRTIRSTETPVNPTRQLNTLAATEATLDVPFVTHLRSTEIPVAFRGLRVAHAVKTAGSSYLINKASFTIIPLHCAVD
jgi:hypothetical protein